MSDVVGEVSAEVLADRHARLKTFLEDQFTLANPGYTIFDPVVRTNEQNIRIGDGSRIDSFCKLEGGLGLTIGRYVHIASFAHIGIGGGTVIIEDFAACSSGSKVVSGSNMVDALSGSAVAPQTMQRIVRDKVTRICRYAILFTNAVVLPGVTIGEGAVLAAGSVATKDVPAWEIWAGTPAKFMRKREIVIGRQFLPEVNEIP
jgi:galactoside O-acetyltransferase